MSHDPTPDISWLLSSCEGFVDGEATKFGMDGISGVGISIGERLIDPRAKFGDSHEECLKQSR
jgi:hypothetical protein